jgi:hypothetical protein
VLAATPAAAQNDDTPGARDGAVAAIDLSARLADVEARLELRPADVGLALERLGTLWLIGVDREDAVRAGLASLDTIDAAEPVRSDSVLAARATAYRGAFRALQGKHAFWPHDKLNHVRDGLGLLDRAIDASPDDAQTRYLRLMTGFYLPGLFGRGDEVAADFDALAALLPDSRADFPGELFEEVVHFVLENADISEPLRAGLRAALAAA